MIDGVYNIKKYGTNIRPLLEPTKSRGIFRPTLVKVCLGVVLWLRLEVKIPANERCIELDKILLILCVCRSLQKDTA